VATPEDILAFKICLVGGILLVLACYLIEHDGMYDGR